MCLVVEAAKYEYSPKHSPSYSRDGYQLQQLEQIRNRYRCSICIYNVKISVKVLEAASDFGNH